MKITFYGYNAFLIESGDKKIAIDPGATFLYFFRLTPLIPRFQWPTITHIFVTHGDPDHYWHMDRVANASGAHVICNATMVKKSNGETFMLNPRKKGLGFTTPMKNLHPVEVGETLELDGMSVTGLEATHGPLSVKFGPFLKIVSPDPEKRIGWGAIGFNIHIGGKTLINLGDTFSHILEWRAVKRPDVLMIPIGGETVRNTMDASEALRVVKAMQPRLVIPCHYNCPAFFSKKFNPADGQEFKEQVEQTGSRCAVLQKDESIDV